jgi:hypothetical protein
LLGPGCHQVSSGVMVRIVKGKSRIEALLNTGMLLLCYWYGTSHISPFRCHLSPVTCHMSHVTCHCHLSVTTTAKATDQGTWLCRTHLDHFRLFLTIFNNLDQFEPVGTCLDLFGPFWTFLELFHFIGPMYLDLFGPIWTSLDLFGSILTYLDQFGHLIYLLFLLFPLFLPFLLFILFLLFLYFLLFLLFLSGLIKGFSKTYNTWGPMNHPPHSDPPPPIGPPYKNLRG